MYRHSKLAVLVFVFALCRFSVAIAQTDSTPKTIGSKTLVAWVYLTDTEQRGGGVLTLIDPLDRFDSIVFGERAAGKWMAGSENFLRTPEDQSAWPTETADAKTMVQIAVVYQDGTVTLYRNGELYASYATAQSLVFDETASVLMGLRCISGGNRNGFLRGEIEEARLYDVPLSAEQIAALSLNEDANAPDEPAPLARWTFEGGTAADTTGTFAESTLHGGARISGGRLVLDGSGYVEARRQKTPSCGYGTAPNPFFLPEGRPFGDTFPIYKDGVWHLFCMWMPRFGHFTSRDLIQWEKQPETPFGGCTGSVVEHQGKFYFFFTGGDQDIYLATSGDLQTWELYPNNPILDGDDKTYSRGYFRDPFVFFNEEEKLWWMVVGTRVMGPAGQRAGAVGLAKSKDLLRWELAPALWAPHIGPHTDCPQVIHEGDHWYLLYLQRHTRYRVADSLEGPWRRPPVRDLGTMSAAAGSRPANDGRRWISFPFLVTPSQPNDLAGWGYGGALAVPRQWDFHPDGSITHRPAEIVRAMHDTPAGDRRPLDDAETLSGTWEISPDGTARSADENGGTLLLGPCPADFYFEADVTFDRRDADAHVLLHVDDALLRGYMLSLSPTTDTLLLRPISEFDIDRVLETVAVDLEPNRPIKLRIFRSDTILEVFIDDRAVLTHRLYQHSGGRLALEFWDSPGTFSNVFMRSLEPLR